MFNEMLIIVLKVKISNKNLFLILLLKYNGHTELC